MLIKLRPFLLCLFLTSCYGLNHTVESEIVVYKSVRISDSSTLFMYDIGGNGYADFIGEAKDICSLKHKDFIVKGRFEDFSFSNDTLTLWGVHLRKIDSINSSRYVLVPIDTKILDTTHFIDRYKHKRFFVRECDTIQRDTTAQEREFIQYMDSINKDFQDSVEKQERINDSLNKANNKKSKKN